jgi:hypothetical protein
MNIYFGLGHLFEILERPGKQLVLRDTGFMGPISEDGFVSRKLLEFYRKDARQTMHWVTQKITNESYVVKHSTIMGLERMAKNYHWEDFIEWFKRYWEEWDDIYTTNSLGKLAKNRPQDEHELQSAMAEFRDDIFLSDIGPDMKKARIMYLKEENANLSSQIEEIKTNLRILHEMDSPSWFVNVAKSMSNIEKLYKELKSNRGSIAYYEGTQADSRHITAEMKAQARKVPYGSLIKAQELSGYSQALCPFHNEKNPSFTIYNNTNRAHCHGCGWNGDTIQFIVESKNMSFDDAVRLLLRY